MSEKKEDFFFSKASLPEGEAVTLDEAEESLLRRLEESGGNCKKTLWQLARARSKMGKHSEAIGHVQKLLQLTDDIEENASCFLGLGQLMEQIGDFASAAEYYQAGLLLRPSGSGTWYWLNNNLGFCLNQIERYDEAELYLRRAITVAPKMSNAYKNLGLCFQGKGDYVRAAKCLILALKVNASDARPLKLIEELIDDHPEVLCDIPDLPGQIERGFTLEADDLIHLFFGVLKRVPEAARAEGLRVSRDLLGGDGLRTVISRLLASELHNPDGPWHVLARDHLQKVEYGALISELEADGHGVAEPASPHDGARMTQRRLFD